MAILTQSGRAAIAAALAERPIHLAWGTGTPDWDAEGEQDGEVETVTATTLVNEIGRRKITSWQFVVPDDEGEIIVNDPADPTDKQKFSPSPENAPTNHLFLSFKFDFDDAPAATIREIGVFTDTITDPDLPPGQMYFEPADIVDPGILLAVEHTPFFNRQPAIRNTFELVITI
jgi:hypothetical protein